MSTNTVIRDLSQKLESDIKEKLGQTIDLHHAVEDNSVLLVAGILQMCSAACAPGIIGFHAALERIMGRAIPLQAALLTLPQLDNRTPLKEALERAEAQWRRAQP